MWVHLLRRGSRRVGTQAPPSGSTRDIGTGVGLGEPDGLDSEVRQLHDRGRLPAAPEVGGLQSEIFVENRNCIRK
eukprot:8030246-Pyramimonas_sp.AAC.1